MTEPNSDGETLRRMYVDEGMTIAAIARTLRMRKHAVCEALAHWDIPRLHHRPRPHSWKPWTHR